MKQTIILSFLFLVLAFGSAQAAAMKLTWKDNSTNEDGFRIERRLQAEDDTKFVEVGKVQVNIVNFTDNTPTEVTYCYRVIAFNQAYNSLSSNVACGFMVPNAPSNLIVTN